MKAKIKPRINLEGRTALQTVIPISTPFVLFVDPASTCNFRCKFCPTGDSDLIKSTGRWQGLLTIDLYKKVIDDLREFDLPLKVLRLYKEGEPLLNARLPDMIDYAKKSARVSYIDTTTNGYLLTPEKSLRLIEAGLDRLNISVNGLSEGQFHDFTRVKVDFEAYVRNIRFFYEHKGNCEVCIKMPGDLLSTTDKQFFFDTFGDISDRIALENIAPCWPEFDVEDRMSVEIKKGIYDNPLTDVKTCPYIFYSLSVNSDGTVSLCFLDWARKLIVGDTRKQSLMQIWKGDALFSHQIAHLFGKRFDNPTCKDCGQLSHCLPDNIDPYAQELAKKLLARRRAA
ncbi:MAG: radical SAM protein [Elusimicrobia bacterium]|nr:radical SAM protein [Elusimicrobiota bacterium]